MSPFTCDTVFWYIQNAPILLASLIQIQGVVAHLYVVLLKDIGSVNVDLPELDGLVEIE